MDDLDYDPYAEFLYVIDEVEEEEAEEEEEEDEEGEEEEDEEEEEEDEDDDGEGEEDGDEVEVVNAPPSPLPPVQASASRVSAIEEEREKVDSEGAASSSSREDVEGLCCPICLEPWSNAGDHQPSCLTCGHLFGMSCIKKWLGQRRNSGKCPQCNMKCTLKDVRRIYGSRIVVVDEESQKRIRFLEAKCDSLEKKDVEWRRKEAEWREKLLVWKTKEAELRQKFEQLNERTSNLERTLGDMESKSMSCNAFVDGNLGRSAIGNKVGLTYNQVSPYIFSLQKELLLDGARYFDVYDPGQILIFARRPTRIGGSHMLTKMSLVSPHEQDNIILPSTIKAIRDLHVSPFGSLALLASMGKKLSIVSMESKNIVLNYDLPAAAWSCSWDINTSHHVHAGLQNGMLLVFDLRQTASPLESRNGLTCNPIHTIYSLPDDSTAKGFRKLLTASSVGLCEWKIGGAHVEPVLIKETGNQGVCISAAYNTDNIVATFRPKVEMTDEIGASQLSQTPSSSVGYHHVQGSHVLIERLDSGYQKLGSTCGYVPGIRLPKSTIFRTEDDNLVYACGDESTSNLVLQELPFFSVNQRLPMHHPVRDAKYTESGLLCCLSEDRMQLFSRKLL